MATNGINRLLSNISQATQDAAGVAENVTNSGQSDSSLKTRYLDARLISDYLSDGDVEGIGFGGLIQQGDNGQFPMSDFYSVDLQAGNSNNNRVFVSYGQIEFQD